MLETAWAGQADVLVTANLRDFLRDGGETLLDGRAYRLTRGGRTMILAHPFEAAGWLRDGTWRTAKPTTAA